MQTRFFSVVLVEDDWTYSSALAELISSADYYYMKATYGTCEEAIARLASDKPDIVLMDLDLPGLDGIYGCQRIKQLDPSIQTVVLTVHSSSEKVFRALCAGAVGYLTKDSDLNSLISALDEIRSGGAPMSFEIARMVVNSFSRDTSTPLSAKEAEVLELLAAGKSYKTIALLQNISINTVKFHIKNIYLTLQVASREAAIDVAKRNNWI